MLRPRTLFALAVAAALGLAPAAIAGGEDVRALEGKFRDVAARSIPATVLVKSTLADGSGRAGFGSGATISADGYILTCAHVVDMAGEVEVTFASGESYPAKVLGKNPKQDYALLKVEASGLPFFKLGDSRRVALGEWVVALGHPGGPYPDVQPAFSVGRVTGLHRRLPVQMMDRYYDDAIRTDAPIFAGNSGGPLISLEGELVGLNGAILLINENSYAVPMHEIAPNLERLKAGHDLDGRAPRGGETPFDEFQGKDLARFLGKAGRRLLGREGLGKLIPGEGASRDEIARMLDRFGKSLEGERAQQMIENLLETFGGAGGQGGERPPGAEPEMPDLGDLRKRIEDLFGERGQGGGPDLGDLRKRIEEMLGGKPPERPEPPAAAERPSEAPVPKVFLGIAPDPKAEGLTGVRIAEVVAGSPAEKAGLKAGDILVDVGGRRIERLDDLGRALAARRAGETVAVRLLRGRMVAGVPVSDERRIDVTLVARPEEGK